jgi:dihydroneopterin aldolase/D-erythro-7,8-dihydroneopterin triphosphate epimerase
MSSRPLDRLHIRDLALRCVIGVYPQERRQKQDVLLNITLHADLRRAGRTDRLEDSVDYKRVKQETIAAVEGSSFQLLEALAERVAAVALRDPRVRRADVSIQKPGALRFARCAELEITRDQPASGRRAPGRSRS